MGIFFVSSSLACSNCGINSSWILLCNSTSRINLPFSSPRDGKELNETEILKIKDELASNFGANIKLNYKYDPSLIGGLIIKVESTMIDTSIKSKLKQLETKMVEA